ISTPITSPTRDTTCMASSECPPRSKKFSSIPTRSTPSTSPQIPATNSSPTVRAPALSSSPSPSCPPSSSLSFISASFRRSTFPLPVNGISSTLTTAPGTMYSGNLPFTYSRSFFPSTSPTTYATNTFSPSPSPPPCLPLTPTTHSFTPSYPLTTRSISPNSTRYPLTFTCPSFLPTYSKLPSLLHLPRSPLRYTRSPSLPLTPSGTNLSPVIPPRPQYPLPTPSPPIYISPPIPTPPTSSSSSSTYTRVLAIGFPIGPLLQLS